MLKALNRKGTNLAAIAQANNLGVSTMQRWVKVTESDLVTQKKLI
jgi:transposase